MQQRQPYSQSVTSTHRTAFVLMLDQSASMNEFVTFDSHRVTKATAVAEIANRMLFELIERARRETSIRNYYDVAVLSYSGDRVRSLLSEQEQVYKFIPICDLAKRQVEQKIWCSDHQLKNGEVITLRSVTGEYVKPQAAGSTPMFEAMLIARDMVREWCSAESNRESFPPVIINITDGEFSDCNHDELRDITHQIMSIATNDGEVLLLNLHIATICDEPLIFPSVSEISTSPRLARTLAECSSTMPEAFNPMIREYRGGVNLPPYKGMSYNAPITEVLNMMNIGSISINRIY